MAHKSATTSMVMFKTFCTKRITDVLDAVKEYTGKIFALTMIEYLEVIRGKLMEQEDCIQLKSYETDHSPFFEIKC